MAKVVKKTVQGRVRYYVGSRWFYTKSKAQAIAGGKAFGRTSRSSRASSKKASNRAQKDVASDVILVAGPASDLFVPVNAPYVAYSVTFDGDVRDHTSSWFVSASSLADAKKKADAAWKSGKFGKAGAPLWARTYQHKIGKGWYSK